MNKRVAELQQIRAEHRAIKFAKFRCLCETNEIPHFGQNVAKYRQFAEILHNSTSISGLFRILRESFVVFFRLIEITSK